jgi:hypothetical protein
MSQNSLGFVCERPRPIILDDQPRPRPRPAAAGGCCWRPGLAHWRWLSAHSLLNRENGAVRRAWHRDVGDDELRRRLLQCSPAPRRRRRRGRHNFLSGGGPGCVRWAMEDEGRCLRKEEIWKQNKKSKPFMQKYVFIILVIISMATFTFHSQNGLIILFLCTYIFRVLSCIFECANMNSKTKIVFIRQGQFYSCYLLYGSS